MHKVLIVDDERIVKLAIKSLIKWEENGLEFAGTASNGITALEMVDKTMPDIVITDIKMPGMDGIELIKKLGERGFDGEILVLSNYNDFELVKEAMRYGAYDYVLKVTVKSEDFSKLLGELVAKLEKKKGVNREEKVKVKNPHNDREIILKKVFESDNKDFTDEITEMTRLYKMSAQETLYAFAIKAAPKGQDQSLLRLSDILQNIAGELLAKSRWYSAIQIDDNTALLIVMYLNTDIVFTPQGMAERLSDITQTYYNVRTGIVYSEPIKDYNQLFDFSSECIRSSELFFYGDLSGRIIPMGTKVSEDEQALSCNFKAVTESIYDDMLKMQDGRVLDDFRSVIMQASQNHINPYRLKKYIKKLLREVERKLINSGCSSEEVFDEYKNDVDVIYIADTEERLLHNIECMVGEAKNSISKLRSNYRKEVREALDFIEKHVHERITLSDIARYVNLNVTYLCKVFKDVTGKNIIPYVNEEKMKTAYALLSKGDIMIKEAASAVGIDDQFYFNRLFKKYYGITPRELKYK